MFTALFSFLGGTAFRLIFGGVMDFLNKRQDHIQEMEMARLQSQLESDRHSRDMERLAKVSEFGIKEIEAKTDQALTIAEANSFLEAVKATSVRTGILFIDAWNGSIRPAGATVSLLIWVSTMIGAGFILSEFDQSLISAFLGIFVGERIHASIRK